MWFLLVVNTFAVTGNQTAEGLVSYEMCWDFHYMWCHLPRVILGVIYFGTGTRQDAFHSSAPSPDKGLG